MRQLAVVALVGAVLVGGCWQQDRTELAEFASVSCTKMLILTQTEAVNMLESTARKVEAAGFTKNQFHAALVERCPNLMGPLDQSSAGAP